MAESKKSDSSGAAAAAAADNGDGQSERGAPRKEEAENLEKLTDYVDEQQVSLSHYSADHLKKALSEFARQEQELEAKRKQREKELNAIKINDNDLKVIMEQFDYTRKDAERTLRESGGDLKACLRKLIES